MPLTAPLRPRAVLAGLLCSGLLGACAQTMPTDIAAGGCSASRPSDTAGTRLLIRFSRSVDGASPELLQRLQLQAGACVTYRGSVSPTDHAYSFTGVGDGERLRQNLLSWSSVLDVVADDKLAPAGAR